MSRATEIVAGLLTVLRALPEEQLHAVLDGLGIAQERRPEAHRDRRICQVCGFGWVRHKALADHPADGHAWTPQAHKEEADE